MFTGAASKLEDARTILDELRRTRDTLAFRALFNSFLSSARAITDALQKDGAALPSFADWYVGKQAEMRADELLRFIHEARIQDFHKGKHRLAFNTHMKHFSTQDV
jgi:hypothetical protein